MKMEPWRVYRLDVVDSYHFEEEEEELELDPGPEPQ
jgi:hypothetical protein